MEKILHYHASFLLITVSFLYITLDLPFSINYYHLGDGYFRSPSFCLWWCWIDYTLLCASLLLTATASVQRHFLIFNSHWFRIQRTRWFLHFIPLIFCILYPPFWYVVLIYLYPCHTTVTEEDLTCNYPCYSYILILYNIDWIVNYIIPVFIIVLSNAALLCRVIYSRLKLRQRQVNIWKRQKRLTLQLLSFSLLYVFGWGPSTIIPMIQTFLIPDLYDNNPQLANIANSVYFVCPLQTFMCILAIPELVNFIKNQIIRRQRVAVVMPVS